MRDHNVNVSEPDLEQLGHAVYRFRCCLIRALDEVVGGHGGIIVEINDIALVDQAIRAAAEQLGLSEEQLRAKKEAEAEEKRRKEREAEEARQAERKKKANDERKKNDEYAAWLQKDHIRTADEQAHERRDPSKMHEGGLPGAGVPTKFT